jgi:hypothetical protein
MSELEAMVLARTGKTLDQCSQEEVAALIEALDAEGRAHKAHADEILDYAAKRRVESASNDNGGAA